MPVQPSDACMIVMFVLVLIEKGSSSVPSPSPSKTFLLLRNLFLILIIVKPFFNSPLYYFNETPMCQENSGSDIHTRQYYVSLALVGRHQ